MLLVNPQHRALAISRWRPGEKTSLPLLTSKLEGKTLTFETIHHKKHGTPELGPHNKYRVDFVDDHEPRRHILNVQQQPAMRAEARASIETRRASVFECLTDGA